MQGGTLHKFKLTKFNSETRVGMALLLPTNSMKKTTSNEPPIRSYQQFIANLSRQIVGNTTNTTTKRGRATPIGIATSIEKYCNERTNK